MTHRRHKVRFEKPIKVSNGGGGHTRTWQEVCTVRCEVERQRSFRGDVEQLNAGGVASMPGLKVLYCSGYTRNAIIHNGQLDEGVELLTKPFTREALLSRVSEMLSSD